MLQEERVEIIFDYMKQKKFVTVEELAQKMAVSPMTIRRDLNALCEQGRAERCHGGAQLPVNLFSERNFDVKQERNLAEKERIARKALEFIRERDTIYLDSGTTTRELARLLCAYGRQLSVVTNDLNIAAVLADSEVDLTIVGGNVQKDTMRVFGHASEQFLKQFRFSKAFLGGSSVGGRYDLFSSTYDSAYWKRFLLELAGQSYLLVDSGKFGRHSLCPVGSISRFDAVITDKKFDREERERIEELNIHMIGI